MQVKTGLFKDQEVFEISLYTRVMRFEGTRRQIYLSEGEFSLAPDGRYSLFCLAQRQSGLIEAIIG